MFSETFLALGDMPGEAKLLSVNVRGLNNPIKRKRITMHLVKSLSDIIFLQETHIKNCNRHPAPHKKFPTFFSALGSSKSRGVAILLAGHLQFVL